MWWFQLLMPEIRSNYSYRVYYYIRAYLHGDVEAEEVLKPFDEMKQALIKRNSEHLAEVLIQEGMDMIVSGQVGLGSEPMSSLAEFTLLFDELLQYRACELATLMIAWEIQWKTFRSHSENGTHDLATKWTLFSLTHTLPLPYSVYPMENVRERILIKAIEADFKAFGVEGLDLRLIAHKGIKDCGIMRYSFIEYARKSKLFIESQKDKKMENKDKNLRCHFCKEMGHKKIDCFELRRQEELDSNEPLAKRQKTSDEFDED